MFLIKVISGFCCFFCHPHTHTVTSFYTEKTGAITSAARVCCSLQKNFLFSPHDLYTFQVGTHNLSVYLKFHHKQHIHIEVHFNTLPACPLPKASAYPSLLFNTWISHGQVVKLSRQRNAEHTLLSPVQQTWAFFVLSTSQVCDLDLALQFLCPYPCSSAF